MGKKKEEDIKERYQVDNFIISRMKDDSFVISTVSGAVIGMYQTKEKQSMTIAMLVADVENDVHKHLIQTLCMNLLLAHQSVLVDPTFLSNVSDEYVEMHKRIQQMIEKAGEEAGIVNPEDNETDEQILDSVEVVEAYNETGDFS